MAGHNAGVSGFACWPFRVSLFSSSLVVMRSIMETLAVSAVGLSVVMVLVAWVSWRSIVESRPILNTMC